MIELVDHKLIKNIYQFGLSKYPILVKDFHNNYDFYYYNSIDINATKKYK